MKKIISVFQRNYDGNREIRDEVTPGAEWVLRGEGVATRKYDGTCCLVEAGKLYKRRELRVRYATAADSEINRIGEKDGKSEGFVVIGGLPTGFKAATEVDTTTMKVQGWMPVCFEDRWHLAAFAIRPNWPDGTYELIGPKVQGNAEHETFHILIKHSEAALIEDFPRSFESMKLWLSKRDIEGVVFHHPGGRMAKVKKSDFGLTRKPV